ncbi:MAG: response regulator [Reichenbachiella sp.]|uniref:response regulator transcription factor n=1 Tax=Reichenbachiella sp. TaxID=2184521 RepID=UPI00326565D7
MNKSIQVIVLEDGAFQAELLQSKLKSGGYEIMGLFSSGEDLLDDLKKFETLPDVAILDIDVKGKVDGIETARRLHDEYSIPIIFLSQLDDNITRKRIKEVPAIFYSKKDILVSNIELFDAIDRLALGNLPEPWAGHHSYKKLKGDQGDIVSVLQGKESFFLSADSIILIEANKEIALILFLDDGGSIQKKPTRTVLKKVEEELCNSYDFLIRISRKHIININKVSGITRVGEKSYVEFKSNFHPMVSIGRGYLKSIKNRIKEV